MGEDIGAAGIGRSPFCFEPVPALVAAVLAGRAPLPAMPRSHSAAFGGGPGEGGLGIACCATSMVRAIGPGRDLCAGASCDERGLGGATGKTISMVRTAEDEAATEPMHRGAAVAVGAVLGGSRFCSRAAAKLLVEGSCGDVAPNSPDEPVAVDAGAAAEVGCPTNKPLLFGSGVKFTMAGSLLEARRTLGRVLVPRRCQAPAVRRRVDALTSWPPRRPPFTVWTLEKANKTHLKNNRARRNDEGRNNNKRGVRLPPSY